MYSKSELAVKISKLVTCEVPEDEKDAHLAEMSRICHTNDHYSADGALDIDAVSHKILSYTPIAV